MPKLQEIFTTVAIVCHRSDRLSVSQNIFAIILLWARKDENETVYKKDKEKKTKETKTSAWDLNNV